MRRTVNDAFAAPFSRRDGQGGSAAPRPASMCRATRWRRVLVARERPATQDDGLWLQLFQQRHEVGQRGRGSPWLLGEVVPAPQRQCVSGVGQGVEAGTFVGRHRAALKGQ